MARAAQRCFDKVFEFAPGRAPPPAAFRYAKWSSERLQLKKLRLNRVKALLDGYDLESWSRHTSSRDPAGLIPGRLQKEVGPELLTQAWCKFYEILCKFEDVVPPGTQHLRSLHLCEAPGAFVCALNHFLVSKRPEVIQWQWVANTLNPNHESNDASKMIADDRLVRLTLLNWHFGADRTGDITKFCNYENLEGFCEDEKPDLVTADGSVDCMKDPGEQERHVEFLHFAETVTALTVLAEGGSFVLKIFTTFEDTTVNLIRLLTCSFTKVAMFKPCTSKSGNSETYLIAIGYRGVDALSAIWPCVVSTLQHGEAYFKSISMFPLDDDFIQEIDACAELFMDAQTRTITSNVRSYESGGGGGRRANFGLKKRVAELYFRYYEPVRIDECKKVVPYANVSTGWRINHGTVPVKLRYSDRLAGLDIVTGRPVDRVLSSKFVDAGRLTGIDSLFKGSNRDGSTLYMRCVDALDAVVINVETFEPPHGFHRFQQRLFLAVLNGLHRPNLVFVRVPFVTHFLVGLLRLVASFYRGLTVRAGLIMLTGLETERREQLVATLLRVRNVYDTLAGTGSDVVQLIHPGHFDDNRYRLVGAMRAYNDRLLNQGIAIEAPSTSSSRRSRACATSTTASPVLQQPVADPQVIAIEAPSTA